MKQERRMNIGVTMSTATKKESRGTPLPDRSSHEAMTHLPKPFSVSELLTKTTSRIVSIKG